MKKVLVVDDDFDILEALKFVLEEDGYKVETVSKGDGVLKKIEKFCPDIILLDVLLSGEDGREILKKLKRKKYTKNIPVLMISAHPSARSSIVECGADDFISKPFEINDLLEKIKKYTSVPHTQI